VICTTRVVMEHTTRKRLFAGGVLTGNEAGYVTNIFNKNYS
jgi:hypothetical protein